MAIVKVEKPDRKSRYGVRWIKDGKRRFRYFATKSERNDFYNELVAAEKRRGRAILDLSANDAVVMSRCVEMLGSAEAVLLACREYAKQTRLVACDVRDAIRQYLDEKRRLGRDENYHRAMRNILARLAERFPEDFGDWDANIARQWSMDLSAGFAPVTVRNHVKWSSAFCNWAIERGYLRVNPFAKVAVPDVILPEPEFLTVEEMRKLLSAAMERHPETVAYFAIGAFAGIRSSAMARLELDAFDFEKRGILIAAQHAKNKRRVYLDGYEENLWEWLDWAKVHAPEGFELTKRRWDFLRGQVAKLAGVVIPHNGLRHSFCTYHVALYGDAGKTATLLTHRGNVSILYEHYKGNAGKAEGEAWFGIRPSMS